MKNERLQIGMIGTGDFGPVFARYVQEIADLTAICDPSAQARSRFAEISGLHPAEFADYQTLLEQANLDAVVVASPNHTHKEITLAAARRGIHVFCEKAMANSVAECWEMVRACEAAGVRLMVGHKRRLRPPWARMIELCETLGPVVAIDICAYHDARPYDFGGWWTRRDGSGGLLAIIGVHKIDWMRAMCGDVARVRAIAAPQIDARYDFSDTLHLSLEFRSGAIGSLTVSVSYPLLKFRESGGPMVICRNGAIRFVSYMDHLDLFWQHRDDKEPRLERFDDLGFDHAYRLEFGDFVRWITEGRQPCLTWQEGLRCVEVMEAARRSLDQDGAIMTLPLCPTLELESHRR